MTWEQAFIIKVAVSICSIVSTGFLLWAFWGDHG